MSVDLKLEVVVIPVSDVERAKRFYESLGWRLDADFPGARTGVWCSSRLRAHRARSTSARASRRRRRARSRISISWCPTSRRHAPELIGRGADVSAAFHFTGFGGPRVPAPPRRRILRDLRHVQRSGRQQLAAPGDQDASSRTGPQQSGPGDAHRAAAGSGAAARRRTNQPPRSTTGRMLRRLHRRARATGRLPRRRSKEGVLNVERARR